MAKYTVHFLDVWGNDNDGYEVNDIYPSSAEIDILEGMDYPAIVQLLIDKGIVRPSIDVDSVECTGEESQIFIDYDGRPEIELRKKL